MEDHIIFDRQKKVLRLLDQRLLPGKKEYRDCKSCLDVRDAIRDMVVRGAPAIGVSAAFGCALAAAAAVHSPDWRGHLTSQLDSLAAARPTAINLAWAVDKMRPDIANPDLTPEILAALWLDRAFAMQADDIRICEAIGQAGAELIRDGDTVLTHCNAGALATAGYGTALGVIRAAFAQGKKIRVIADETRPFFQGSRLTAWELAEDGIPVKIACDNACALLMDRGMVQLAITGADRVAANGDTANKIGTLGVAILARHFHVPFYVACPLSTVDISIRDGSAIPIEERPPAEVTKIADTPVAPPNVEAYNFAFDVTPAELIDGIITEAGLLRPPYGTAIAGAIAKNSCGQ